MALPHSSASIPDGTRIHSLDVLRGLAVLGILAVNAAAFALPFAAAIQPGQISFADAPGADVAVWVTKVFFEQKFIALFYLAFRSFWSVESGMILIARPS